MRVVHIDGAERYEPEPDWNRLSLCAECDISIEHFTKPPGHASPLHDHPSAQVLVVLSGRLAIWTEADGEVGLGEGDAAYIPGGEPHIVTNPLGVPSAGLDIFVPGRSFDFWTKRKKAGAP